MFLIAHSPALPSPSGHSRLSGAYAGVLARFFRREAENFSALAEEAGEARIVGGIHLRSGILAGEAIGRSVADAVWQRASGTSGA